MQKGFLTQANMEAQSDALKASGLEAHGFRYINIDSGWQGSFDSNGRPIPNTTTFPDIKALVDHIHTNGQLAGIYWIPGVEYPAVVANSPILGTPYHIDDILEVPYTRGNAFGANGPKPYHYKIDFTKPGTQEYINSVVDLFTSWGIDLIKLDGVTPGSYVDSLAIDNRPDVTAWSQAIAQSGRNIWLTISWALDKDYLSTWQQYANARRIDADVQCEHNCATITDWAMMSWRFYDLVGWKDTAGPAVGWNDMDALDVVNSTTSGLSEDERRTAVTLWSMANAPLYLGGDLTTLDSFSTQLLTNDQVLAVDQSGHPGQQVLGGDTPVWVSHIANKAAYVSVSNLNAFPVPVFVPWRLLGFDGAVSVHDLWSDREFIPQGAGFHALLPGHGSRLLRVIGMGQAAPEPNAEAYLATDAILTGTAKLVSCAACAGGEEDGYLGVGPNNNAIFNDVNAPGDGTYYMQVNSMTSGPRSLLYRVNGEPWTTLNVGGGSFALPSGTTVPIHLQAGLNSIEFGNPTSYPPGLDNFLISGDGAAPHPFSATYEAENATFSGTVSASYCEYCSGASKAGNIGGGSADNVTFSNVTVPAGGMYQMEIDYLTSGPRSYTVTVNHGMPFQLNLNGSSFSLPTSIVIPVELKAGVNSIQLGNATGYAPALDRIAIAAAPAPTELQAAITAASGNSGTRSWTFTLSNNSRFPDKDAQITNFALTQTAGSWSCTAQTTATLPLAVGTIRPGGNSSAVLPVDFSACPANAQFDVELVFSANSGTTVGTMIRDNVSE
ncbi:MAG TPA: CBM35 domain-containing protein [Acidobacteriaceae bacterium]|nr:CBM35 domain-containing protein [Acidobacteriaceae bacterium]